MVDTELHVFEWPTCSAAALSSLAIDDVPLVFDLDGTLIKEDSASMLWAAAIGHSWKMLQDPPRFVGLGRHELAVAIKDWVVRVLPNVADVLDRAVINPNVVSFAKAAQAQGRPIWLVSGTMQPVADYFALRLAQQWDLSFAVVRGSQWPVNLISKHKASWLCEAAPNGFDYVGDHLRHDRPIWATARAGFWVATKGATSAIALQERR